MYLCTVTGLFKETLDGNEVNRGLAHEYLLLPPSLSIFLHLVSKLNANRLGSVDYYQTLQQIEDHIKHTKA